jgi:hypothetical protein
MSGPSEMEHAPKGLAFLQQLDGLVDVREGHIVCYEPIKVYIQVLCDDKVGGAHQIKDGK